MKVADVLRARVNQVLVEQKKTPADLARALKRKSSWFSNFMHGRNATPLKTVDLIAEALHVDGCSLFDPSRLGQTAQPVEVTDLAAHAEEGAPAMMNHRRESLRNLVNGLADDQLLPALSAILDVMAASPGGDRRAIHEPNGTGHGSG